MITPQIFQAAEKKPSIGSGISGREIAAKTVPYNAVSTLLLTITIQSSVAFYSPVELLRC